MSDVGPNANREILDEVNEAAAWFYARKVRPIWAKPVDRAEPVETLEGVTLPAAGSFLCRGESGDVWPQSAQELAGKYTPTDDFRGDGWRKYVPRPDADGVFAAQIGHPFCLVTAWGKMSGKSDDFIVKNYKDRDLRYPEEVWIVDQLLFLATYDRADEPT